jgi:hypothetical protein
MTKSREQLVIMLIADCEGLWDLITQIWSTGDTFREQQIILIIWISSYHNSGHHDWLAMVYFVFNNRDHWNQSIINNDDGSCLSDALKLGLTCINTL